MTHFVTYFIWTWAIVQFVNGDSFPVGAPNQQSLANLIFTSSLASKDPQAAFACFGVYLQEINFAGQYYKGNYTDCLIEAKEFRKRVDNSLSSQRAEMLDGTREVCKRWESCNERNATLDIFMCHSQEGVNKARNIYNISDTADEYANELLVRYREIESNYEYCCKLAERKYANVSAGVYNILRECLKGRTETETRTLPGTVYTTADSTVTESTSERYPTGSE